MIATGAAALLVVVAFVDWTQRRIPNSLCLALMILGVLSFVGLNGLTMQQWLINVGIAACLTLPGYALGHLGGGDVKLMLALSPLWPPISFLWAFAAGVFGLTLIIVAIDLIRQDNTLKERGLPLGTAVCLGVLSLPLAAAI